MLWFGKKKEAPKRKRRVVTPVYAEPIPDYSVDETELTELSDTDLSNITLCQQREEQLKSGELLTDSDLFRKTRWGQDRRDV